jgi:hypothetical protein
MPKAVNPDLQRADIDAKRLGRLALGVATLQNKPHSLQLEFLVVLDPSHETLLSDEQYAVWGSARFS